MRTSIGVATELSDVTFPLLAACGVSVAVAKVQDIGICGWIVITQLRWLQTIVVGDGFDEAVAVGPLSKRLSRGVASDWVDGEKKSGRVIFASLRLFVICSMRLTGIVAGDN